MLVVMQRQSSMIQKVARTAEISQVPFTDRIVDVLVMMQSQVPTSTVHRQNADVAMAIQRQASRDVATLGYHDQKSSGTMSSSQEQHTDKVANVPVAMRDSSQRRSSRETGHVQNTASGIRLPETSTVTSWQYAMSL